MMINGSLNLILRFCLRKAISIRAILKFISSTPMHILSNEDSRSI